MRHGTPTNETRHTHELVTSHTQGHELAGICTAVGSKVTLVKVGDQVGVGCMVDS